MRVRGAGLIVLIALLVALRGERTESKTIGRGFAQDDFRWPYGVSVRHGAIVAFLFVLVVMRLRKIHHKIVLFLPSTAKSTTTLSVNVSVPGAQPQMARWAMASADRLSKAQTKLIRARPLS